MMAVFSGYFLQRTEEVPDILCHAIALLTGQQGMPGIDIIGGLLYS